MKFVPGFRSLRRFFRIFRGQCQKLRHEICFFRVLKAEAIHFGILSGIDLSLPSDGAALAVLGPSNAGKSLLLKVLAGLRRPERGRVFLDDKEVTGKPHPSIGMTFQQGGLFDSWTVGENLAFALQESRVGLDDEENEIALVLSAVGLQGTSSRYLHELSGGMQKRLGIARALLLKPQVLLLDEPTAGLDPLTSRQILTLIDDLKKTRGVSIVLVTSDPAQAEQVCQDMIFLVDGKVLDSGAFSELVRSGSAEARQFLSASAEGPL